jgi:hypothetical protein
MHFFQSCPICGRSLRIRVTLLGRKVYCRHCGGGFPARDGSSPAASLTADRCQTHFEPSLSERVDYLLEQASVVLARAAAGHGPADDGVERLTELEGNA